MSTNSSEVKIENTDMELDFNENAEEDTQDESDGSDIQGCTPDNKFSSQHQGKMEEMENNLNHSDALPVVSTPASDESRVHNQEPSPQNIEMAAIPPSASPQIKNPEI